MSTDGEITADMSEHAVAERLACLLQMALVRDRLRALHDRWADGHDPREVLALELRRLDEVLASIRAGLHR